MNWLTVQLVNHFFILRPRAWVGSTIARLAQVPMGKRATAEANALTMRLPRRFRRLPQLPSWHEAMAPAFAMKMVSSERMRVAAPPAWMDIAQLGRKRLLGLAVRVLAVHGQQLGVFARNVGLARSRQKKVPIAPVAPQVPFQLQGPQNVRHVLLASMRRIP